MKLFYFTLFGLLASSGALAQTPSSFNKRGDMFYDKHWIYDRPWVRSDMYRGEEVVTSPPPMLNTDADVFDRMPKKNFMGRDDMFPHRWINTVPDHVLVIDP